ncbi:unnamed protein product [Microthlaspi erraticum]|uniref:Uncharacterized protein n=1 Tax=Microthlaspi erraticum TaxID=1685480 RepID=A0A6D2IKI7_9BRAS|nr:unnamed protein product [Microthlaspi erraticum]
MAGEDEDVILTVTSRLHRQCRLWYCIRERNPIYCSAHHAQVAATENGIPRAPMYKGHVKDIISDVFQKVFTASCKFDWCLTCVENFNTEMEDGERNLAWAFFYPAMDIPIQNKRNGGSKWKVSGKITTLPDHFESRKWVCAPQPNNGRWKLTMYYRTGENPVPWTLCFIQFLSTA